MTNSSNVPPRTVNPQAAAAVATILPRRGSFWSDKVLTAHAPYRPESGGSAAATPGALDQNEDIQLLNVIEAYYRKIPGNAGKDLAGAKTRKLSNTSKLHWLQIAIFGSIIELQLLI